MLVPALAVATSCPPKVKAPVVPSYVKLLSPFIVVAPVEVNILLSVPLVYEVTTPPPAAAHSGAVAPAFTVNT